jgi:hypothetical protein
MLVMFPFDSNPPSTKLRSFVYATSLQIFDVRRISLTPSQFSAQWIPGQQMNTGWLAPRGKVKIRCLSICKAPTFSVGKVMTSRNALRLREIPPTRRYRPFLLRSYHRLLHTSTLQPNKLQKGSHLTRNGSFSNLKLSDCTSTRMFPSVTLLGL